MLSTVEQDLSARLQKERERVEEESRTKQEESRREQELAAKKQQEDQTAAALPPPVATVTPVAPVTATSASTPALQASSLQASSLQASCSPDNLSWHQQTMAFKAQFVQGVVFSDQEKSYKFDLQKAINTPLNSLSGVSSSHLQVCAFCILYHRLFGGWVKKPVLEYVLNKVFQKVT